MVSLLVLPLPPLSRQQFDEPFDPLARPIPFDPLPTLPLPPLPAHVMSVELLEEDGVLVEPPQAGVPAAAAAAAAVAPASSTSPSTSESAPSATADSAAKGAIPVGAIPTYTISSAMASALAKKVDEAERATDTPQPKKDGKLDALSVQLPHLPSPFDAIYPRSRGGAEWKSIVDDGHCMMCQITPGDGKGNVPVLNRVYGTRTQRTHMRYAYAR